MENETRNILLILILLAILGIGSFFVYSTIRSDKKEIISLNNKCYQDAQALLGTYFESKFRSPSSVEISMLVDENDYIARGLLTSGSKDSLSPTLDDEGNCYAIFYTSSTNPNPSAQDNLMRYTIWNVTKSFSVAQTFNYIYPYFKSIPKEKYDENGNFIEMYRKLFVK